MGQRGLLAEAPRELPHPVFVGFPPNSPSARSVLYCFGRWSFHSSKISSGRHQEW